MGRLCLPLSLLLILLSTSQGRRSEVHRRDGEWTVSTTDGLRRAVVRLKDSETVLLDASTIRLTSTLVLDAPNTVLRSAQKRTTLFCPPNGSAIIINAANVTLEGLTLTGCEGYAAIEIRRANQGSLQNNLTLERVAFIDNRNSELGAGLRIEECSSADCDERPVRAQLRRCVFRQNSASSGAAIGGSHCELNIRDTRFARNVARSGDGGAISANESDIAVTNSRFIKNEAAGGGGAIYLTGIQAKLNATSTLFERNAAAVQHLNAQPSGEVSEAGGAIALHPVRSFVLRDCTFKKNWAILGGALCVLQDERVSDRPSWEARVIDGCIFSENGAPVEPDHKSAENGGAILVHGTWNQLLISISHTVFTANSAVRGGAIAAFSYTPSTIQLKDENNTFESNSAVSGGGTFLSGDVSMSSTNSIFRENSAENGGALSLVQRSIFRVVPGNNRVTVANNTAIRGGGVMCRRCGYLLFRSQVLFFGNVAREHGGALFVFEFQGILVLSAPRFEENVAAVGGAVALWDHGDATIGAGGEDIVFTRNTALTGGALFIKAENAVSVTSWIENVLFENNEAIRFSTESKASDSAALKRWREKWRQELSTTDQQRPSCDECLDGRGGALFLGFRNIRTDASVYQYLKNITIRNNSALIGGGSYIAMHRSRWDLDVGYWQCRAYSRSARYRPCYGLGQDMVIVENNTAELAAGGLFLRSVKRISSVFTFDVPLDQTVHQTGLQDVPMLIRNNRVENGSVQGYGPQVATDAVSLHLINVNHSLTGFKSGQRLCVETPSNETSASGRCSAIMILIKDSLNQTITAGSDDSNMSVSLRSSWISGTRRYVAKNGVITVDDTTVIGVNITKQLVVRSKDNRGISVSFNFSLLPCSDGELVDDSQSRCFRCDLSSYTFDSNEECKPCESHAICRGTMALVPRSGYWHSTPYSPFMRRCLSRKACSGDDRKERLIAYYNDSVSIARELRDFGTSSEINFRDYQDTYPQCRPGYTGILCGTCSNGYGHSSSGDCVRCSRTIGVTRFLTVLSAFLLFTVVTIKLLLEIDGVRKDVLFELAEQRRELAIVIQQAASPSSTSKKDKKKRKKKKNKSPKDNGGSNSSSQTSESPNTSQCSTPAPDKDLSKHSSGKKPRPVLYRSPPASDPLSRQFRESFVEAPSSDAMDASGVLSETYKILFNYVQLNSVALSLDIDWKETLNNLLAIQSSVGRITSMNILPFDCNFENRDNHDSNARKSLAALWYRACFPLMTVVVHIMVTKIYQYRRREKRRTGPDINLLPPMRLIFLVVYLSYCIDISTDLLRVLNCIHIPPVDRENGHVYAQYEILDSKYLWAEDTNQTCWEGAHLVATVFAVIGLSTCLGMIAFTIRILYIGKRDFLLRNPTFLLRYGFLYLGYRKEGLALYWESVITVRRILLAAIGVYAHHRETSNAQIGLLAIVIFTSIALHEIVQPYNRMDFKASFPSYAGSNLRYLGLNDLAGQWLAFNQYLSLNALEGASLFMSLSLFLVGMSINDRKATDFEAHLLLIICFCLNGLFVAFLLYRLWCGLHHSLDVNAKEMSIPFGVDDDAGASETWLVVKVWLVLKATILEMSETEAIPASPTASV